MRIIDLLRIRNKTHSIFCWKRYTVSWIFLLIKEKRKERIGTVVYTHAHAMRAYTTLHTYIHTYTYGERERVCVQKKRASAIEREKKKSKWNWSSQCIIVAALSFVCRSVNNLSVPKKKVDKALNNRTKVNTSQLLFEKFIYSQPQKSNFRQR